MGLSSIARKHGSRGHTATRPAQRLRQDRPGPLRRGPRRRAASSSFRRAARPAPWRRPGLPSSTSRTSPASRRCWTGASRRCTPRSTAASSRGATVPDDLAAIARARHQPDRPGGREPVSVRARRREPGDAVRRSDRGDRHRRTEPGPRRGQELPRRARRRRPAGLRARARRARGAGRPSPALRFELARKAFAHTAAYDTTIAVDARRRDRRDDATHVRARRPAGATPAADRCCAVALAALRVLRYGENPHQRAAWYADRAGARLRRRAGPSGQGAVVHEPARPRRRRAASCSSSTSRLPPSSSTRIRAASPPARRSPQAYVTAREADALSAFGGIVGLNRPLDAETARAIIATFIEAVIAPAVDAEALAILAKKPTCACSPPTSRRSRDGRGGRSSCARSWAACSSRSAIGCVEARGAVAGGGGRDGPARRHVASADGRRVAGASLRVARLRARQVQHRSSSPAADRTPRRRRRADEPCRRGEGRGDESRRRARRQRSSPRTRSSRSATASTRWPRPAPRPSCSPAARCATPK